MNSALKPALPQGAGGQNNQSGTSPKSLMGGSQTNHNPHGHMGQMISQSSLHPQNMSNNVLHQNQMSHLSQSIQNVAQNMTMSAHSNQSLAQLGHSVTADYSVSQGTKSPNNSGALSLVQDKTSDNYTNSNQPLALTRSPDKNDIDNGSLPQSNGMSESPKILESALPEESKVSTALISGESQSPPSIVESQTSAESSAESSSDSVTAPNESKPDDLSATSGILPQETKSETVVEPVKEASDTSEIKPPDEKQQTQVSALPENEPEVFSKKTSPEKDIVSAEVADDESVPVPSDEPVAIESQIVADNVCSQVSIDVNEQPSSTDIVEKPQSAPDLIPDKEPSADEPIKEQARDEKVEPCTDNIESNKPVVLASEESKSIQPKTEVAKESDIVSDDSKKDDQPEVPSLTTPTAVRQVYSIKKADNKPKSTLKLATVPPNQARKRRSDVIPPKSPSEGPSPAKKLATPRQKPILDSSAPSTPTESRISKRNRTQVQPYQSPTPELAIVTKLSATQGRSTPTKLNDEKLIVFYKNEYLAVRNAEGGFYVCQAVQNVYRNTRKIKIRWLSQNKELDSSGETYTPDFYDTTDMECVLTTLSLTRAGNSGAQKLSVQEEARAKSILDRAIEAEKSGVRPEATELSEEHPDGLDLSLYKDESQLDKKKEAREAKKRLHSKMLLETKDPLEIETVDEMETAAKSPPKKKLKQTPKKKSTPAKKVSKTPKAKTPAPKTPVSSVKKAAKGSVRPAVSSSQTPAHPTPPSKTATATVVSPPAKTPKKSKNTPGKTNTKSETPKAKTPKSGKKPAAPTPKSAPIQPIPSTSTGKATRTPRKPPSKK